MQSYSSRALGSLFRLGPLGAQCGLQLLAILLLSLKALLTHIGGFWRLIVPCWQRWHLPRQTFLGAVQVFLDHQAHQGKNYNQAEQAKNSAHDAIR